MQKVIIVDDEVHIRNLIKYLIHWEELGMELCGSFGNAEETLDFFCNNSADIVISDIQMPGTNGLAMIEEIKKKNEKTSFVIISGFRDFDFAKKAVKLGVQDYILKPIDEEELNNTLLNLKSRGSSSNDNANKRQSFINILKGERVINDEDKANEEYGYHFKRGGIYLVLEMVFCRVSEDENPKIMADRLVLRLRKAIEDLCIEFEAFNRNQHSELILVEIKEEDAREFYSRLELFYRQSCRDEEQIETINFYLSAGTAVKAIDQLRHTTDSAIFFSGGRLTYGKQRVYIADVLSTNEQLLSTASPDLDKELVRRFERGIESLNDSEISTTIHEVFVSLESEGNDNPTIYLYACRYLFDCLLKAIEKIANIANTEVKHLQESMELVISNADTIMTLQNAFARYCLRTVEQYLSANKHNSQAYVQFAKDYIDKHYAEEISLNDLADKAYINAAYLSSIFKESTGVNYTTYLTNVRIEKAKELLRNLDMNMSEIAEAVGYHNPRYFTRKFEENCGIKPSEYRRMYLRKIDW